MEDKPKHPDWKQLQELLKECSDSEIDSLPVDINPSCSEDERCSQNNHLEEDTDNLLDNIKKLEVIIQKQNQVIKAKNAYIQILEEKLAELEAKQTNTPNTIDTHIEEISNPDTETEKPLQKIADLSLHIQNLQERIQLIKKHRKI